MNERFIALKQKYDDINKQVSELRKLQKCILSQMQQECTHDNLIEIEPDGFLSAIGVDDDNTKYKCKDCFQYFSKQEIKRLQEKKR